VGGSGWIYDGSFGSFLLPAALDGAAVDGAAFLDLCRFGLSQATAIFRNKPAVNLDQGLVVAEIGGEVRLDGCAP
jgi:hypothetical protein